MSHVKMLTVLLVCLSGLACETRAAGITFPNVIGSVKDVGAGVTKDITNLLPTPRGLFDTSKQLIAGYPFEFVSDAINKVCSSALASETIAPKITPDINKMNFQLRTACDKYNYPLLESDKMWRSPEFDPTKKVVIMATGWMTSINKSDTLDEMAKAYNCRGGVNFVALDAAQYVDTLYTWSAFNTELIGEYIAKGLVILSTIVPISNIHLIGHSLGAHIVGSAGRNFYYLTGKNLPHITGLDPAKPCFNEGESLAGINRGDADFIDIIHSDPGVLGKREPMGDVDFYPGGLDPLPPGCISVSCAHQRAVQYFVETVYPGNEYNFLGKRCGSLTRLRSNKCPGPDQPMGYAVPLDIKGNYFLEVNSEPPYGKNAKQSPKAYEKCGLCTEAGSSTTS